MKPRRTLRILSTFMMLAGVLLLAWAGIVWKWGDPVTAVYTSWQQRKLESSFEETLRAAAPAAAPAVAPTETPAAAPAETPAAAPKAKAPARPATPTPVAARRLWRGADDGDAVARLTIDRLDLEVIVVKGTESGSLKKGPGVDGRTALPGEGRLVYIAGHRTTYGAPFGDIERMKPGDAVQLETPYGRFEYVVTTHRIVDDNDLSVLRSPGHEVLALQACHPRFFASQRYIVYARPRTMIRDRAQPAATSA
jgi:sortase A